MEMQYQLKRESTASGVGFFGCSPVDFLNPPEALAYVKAHPNDEFMRKYVIRMMGEMGEEEFYGLVQRALVQDPPPFQAILWEACLMHSKFLQFAWMFEEKTDPEMLGALTPLVFIRGSVQQDLEAHGTWMRLFEDNIMEHDSIPFLIASGLERPYSKEEIAALPEGVRVAEVFRELFADGLPEPAPLPSAEETWRKAHGILNGMDVFSETEQRHTSSLCPIALMREWQMAVRVTNGCHDYVMTGQQISYGKGLNLDDARASLYMEIAERVSSFANFSARGVLGYKKEYPLVQASFGELKEQGRAALDPSSLPLDAPYVGQKLWWMEGHTPDGAPCLVPPQLVFLFCNLDEKKLFAGLDSTGLASGNTLEQAKVAALCEVIERDAEAIGLFDESQCFRLESDDPEVAALLADYEAKGVHVVFQDLTSDLGVPCYKAFVVDDEGNVEKGTAAKLSGPRAALSAMLETMYPYPDSPASEPAPAGLPVRKLEELPDYSTGDPAADLKLLETTLAKNGLTPVYVDLTREDTGIPVAKAFVPGLELAVDFGPLARVSKRLMRRFDEMAANR